MIYKHMLGGTRALLQVECQRNMSVSDRHAKKQMPICNNAFKILCNSLSKNVGLQIENKWKFL